MKRLSTLLAIFAMPFFLNAQVNNLELPLSINDTGTNPDVSAMLDVQSTDKGMLVPRMTTAQRTAISSPATGLIVYDNNTNSFWYFTGSAWTELVNGNPSILSDTDGDTKIQVEESADEDMIRFDLGGLEYFRMDSARLEVLNSGRSVFIGEGAGANDDLSDNNNTFVGYQSGITNSTGDNNVSVGFQSLLNNTTGRRNIAIGANAMEANTTGEYNVAVGQNALPYNTTGGDNVAIGANALEENTTGKFNATLGSFAAKENITGNDNVAVGFGSGQNNQTGGRNTWLGFEAGVGSSFYSASGNVMLGYRAGRFETGSNLLYIENSGSSAPLIWGDFANDSVRINGHFDVTGNAGIGTTTPANRLTVSGDADFTGNVGIGTTTPVAALQIVRQFDNAELLRLSTDRAWAFQQEGTASSTALRLRNVVGGGGKSFLIDGGKTIFRTYDPDDSTTVDKVVVDHDNGRVGIGTATPTVELDIAGSVKIQGGSPGDGKVLTATDNGGNAVWEDRSSYISWGKVPSTNTHGSTDDNWDDVTAVISLTVDNGDYIHLTGQASVRLTGGTGLDPFEFRVTYTGCSTGTTNTITFEPAEDAANHGNYSPIPYNDVITAPCSGTLDFTFQIRNTGDDDWQAQDKILIVKKY